MDTRLIKTSSFSMSVLRLVYFPFKGRAQAIRYLLEDNGIPYEFKEISSKKWEQMKDKTPFGQLPYIVDGDFELAQSGAIMRYLARKHDLYGNSHLESAVLDMLYEAYMDLYNDWARMLAATDNFEDEEHKFIVNLPYRLDKIQTNFEQNEGKDFFVGTKISYVDYAMLDMMHNLETHTAGCLDNYPTLRRFYERMKNRANIKAFMRRKYIGNMDVSESGRL